MSAHKAPADNIQQAASVRIFFDENRLVISYDVIILNDCYKNIELQQLYVLQNRTAAYLM